MRFLGRLLKVALVLLLVVVVAIGGLFTWLVVRGMPQREGTASLPGMYATIADLGKWAASGLGTTLLPTELADRRLDLQPIPEGSYGLGIFDYGHGWIGHTGQLIGWEPIVVYNTETGGAFVAIVNETGSLVAAEVVAVSALPDLLGILS